LIPTIKESTNFKQFLGIDEHFPELCKDTTLSVNKSLIIDNNVGPLSPIKKDNGSLESNSDDIG
jgi:hypothetical protein